MYNYRTHFRKFYIEDFDEVDRRNRLNGYPESTDLACPYYVTFDCACAEAYCEHRVERAMKAQKIRKYQWLHGREGPWPFFYDNYAGIEGRRQHWYKYTDDLDWNKKRPCDRRRDKAPPITNIRIIKPRA